MTPSQDHDATRSHATNAPRANGSLFSRAAATVFVVLVLLLVGSHVLLWLELNRREPLSKEELFWQLCQPGYTRPQRSLAFSELLWLGNREWRSARLEGLDLSGVELAGADIQNANMGGCILTDADLSDCRLRRTQLDNVKLTDAELSGANLFECDMLKSDLRRALFIEADLRGADLGQTTADEATFIAADMTGTHLELASLVGADFSRSRLAEANLSLADLRNANLAGTDLTGADLRQANLSNANWWRAIGLSPDQLASLRKQYPPSSDADESLQQDYQRWLDGQEDG